LSGQLAVLKQREREILSLGENEKRKTESERETLRVKA
jgi:hypothetical protein